MDKPIYETYETSLKETYVKKIDVDGSIYYIPNDPANSDYQAYLASLDEQQAALEAK